MSGFVIFRDAEGYKKATVDSFRIFGVNIEGVPVTTSAVHKCRTVYVENLGMQTGEKMVEAINKVIQPYYEVRQGSTKKKKRNPTSIQYLVPFSRHRQGGVYETKLFLFRYVHVFFNVFFCDAYRNPTLCTGLFFIAERPF